MQALDMAEPDLLPLPLQVPPEKVLQGREHSQGKDVVHWLIISE